MGRRNATGGSGGFGGGGGYGPAGGGGAGYGGGTATTTGGGGGGAGLGGAIFTMQGQLTIVDSTLTANSAVGGADNVSDHAKGIGGAVFNLSGSLSVTASTFFANTAAYDGASIYNLVYDGAAARSAQATLTDTIVAGGQGPFDLTSAKPSAVAGAPNLGTATADVSRFDLVRTMRAVGAGSISGSPLTLDPLLGPLQNNGGPTQTLAPLTGSPVIDAGGGCPATDQRGQPRPDNGETACDIGAYEVQDPPARRRRRRWRRVACRGHQRREAIAERVCRGPQRSFGARRRAPFRNEGQLHAEPGCERAFRRGPSAGRTPGEGLALRHGDRAQPPRTPVHAAGDDPREL